MARRAGLVAASPGRFGLSVDLARERRALDAFDAAVEWPVTGRDERLAALLADDPALIATVQALLAAERDADLMPTGLPDFTPFDSELPAPDRVGAYRPVELIGRGGMGSVYRGERIDGGFEQTVAIKLIRGGLFTAAVAEQFAQERQILARLHHPHITQLHDGGLTPDGQSYIVMELVHGASILDHVATEELGLDARLDLFRDVCAAIAYAHSQGVVHADIKPSNIVIDRRHGVKLLDFGISGLIGAEAEATGFRAATPGFASPQQLAHAPASAADDIFALGALLRVLVADQPGYDAELSAVVDKASAPDPADRYAGVEALAADIDRWRRLEPVLARPSRRLRQLWFFWRRNRLAVSLWSAAAFSLVAAVLVMTVLYLNADAERRQANQRFTEVRALSRYMLSDVTGALEQFPGTAPLRSELAHRGRVYLEGLSRIPDAPADVRLEVAQGYAKTGDILGRLGRQNAGDPRAGDADLAEAESRLRTLHAAMPTNDDISLTLAQVLMSRAGIALNAVNQPKLAASRLAEACVLSDGVARRRPALVAAHMAHVTCLSAQANLADFEGRYADVVPVTDVALAEIHALPPRAASPAAALTEAKILGLKGDALYYLNQKTNALATLVKAAGILDEARARNADVRLFDQLAMMDYNIAATLDDLGRKREELTWIDQGVLAADQVRAFEDSPHAWRTVNMVHLQRATTLASLGRFDEAIAEANANIAARRAIAEHSPHDNLAIRAVPVGLRPLGDIYWQAGRRREACGVYADARALWERLNVQGGVLGSDRSGELVLLDGKLRRCEAANLEPSRR
jgi:serine/threonine-protein kinase